MNQREDSICRQCVMDGTDPDFELDSDGVCNYCRKYSAMRPQIEQRHQQKDQYFDHLRRTLRANSSGKYDSIIGISGGVDSSYAVMLAKQQGLNPLCVHLDNGWNSETSVSNIKKIIDKTGFDLFTYVLDWPEFRDLQRSFFEASVLDIEMLTDHAIFALLFRYARDNKIKNALTGNNIQTEFGMPEKWSWNKKDITNIRGIHRRFGKRKLKTFPSFSTFRYMLVKRFGLGMQFHEILNYINYRKTDAIKELESEFGFVYYGGKHYESRFTKFYQAYILPRKFGIDKRKSHFSGLIRNGEMTREEAIEELSADPYPAAELDSDREFVLKKLGYSSDEFDRLMKLPIKQHTDYPSDHKMVQLLSKVYRGTLGRLRATS